MFYVLLDEILADYYDLNRERIRCIAYAPGGEVNNLAAKEDELPLFRSLFERESLPEDAVRSVETGYTTINGPYALEDGSKVFIVAYPIYRKGEAVSRDNFLGFTAVVVGLEQIVSDNEVNTLVENGYQYYLTKEDIHPEHEKLDEEVIVNGGLKVNSDVALYNFEISGYLFHLGVRPANGWVDYMAGRIRFLIEEVFVVLIIIILNMIHQMKLNSLALAERSITDTLTGLKNRQAIRNEFAEFNGHMILVTMMDIDYFKQFNDTYGHEMGDVVLCRVADEIKKHLSPTFNAFRFGGDEFLTWDICGNEKVAIRRIQDIADAVAQIHIDGCDLPIRISYGTSYGKTFSAEELHALRDEADARLYEVKRNRKKEESA